MNETAEPKKRVGRPRDESSRRAVLDAAIGLLVEAGFEKLTIEGIARRSGTSKQTIYRWWPTRSAILIEALRERADREAPLLRTGDLAADVAVLVRRTTALLARPEGRVLAALMGQAQLDPEFGAQFRTGFLTSRRHALRDLVTESDESIGVDAADLASEVVFSMLWYRLLSDSGPLDDDFAALVASRAVTIART